MSGGCRKRRYASLDEAEAVLLRAKIARALGRQIAARRREQRVYACRNCAGWHGSALDRTPDEWRSLHRLMPHVTHSHGWEAVSLPGELSS